eukprot:3101360-Prymnesium_polylepis.1
MLTHAIFDVDIFALTLLTDKPQNGEAAILRYIIYTTDTADAYPIQRYNTIHCIRCITTPLPAVPLARDTYFSGAIYFSGAMFRLGLAGRI